MSDNKFFLNDFIVQSSNFFLLPCQKKCLLTLAKVTVSQCTPCIQAFDSTLHRQYSAFVANTNMNKIK